MVSGGGESRLKRTVFLRLKSLLGSIIGLGLWFDHCKALKIYIWKNGSALWMTWQASAVDLPSCIQAVAASSFCRNLNTQQCHGVGKYVLLSICSTHSSIQSSKLTQLPRFDSMQKPSPELHEVRPCCSSRS